MALVQWNHKHTHVNKGEERTERHIHTVEEREVRKKTKFLKEEHPGSDHDDVKYTN